MVQNRDTGPPETRIPQYITTAIVGLICTAAIGGFGLARSLDNTVIEHAARLRNVEERIADLCESLQCRTHSAHPLCTRLRLIEKTFMREHPEDKDSLFD